MNRIIGFYNKSVYMTYLGMGFALFGVYMCLLKEFNYAMVMLILSGICDLLDGIIARKVKRNDQEKEFGVQIDSLVDVINFLVLPAVFFISSNYFNSSYFIIVLFYVLAGIIRLAYFNVVTSKGESEEDKTYTGLPVTFSALFIPVFYIAFNNVIVLYLYLVLGVLFILNFKFKKPGMKVYIFVFILAIVMSSYLLMA